MPNRLASSHSAYLRQHADNPVEWYEWGEEAFARARELDRPIFLSVGYAACHWCHVMAHESFENPDIAALVNDNFVAIKVDREERPDVDAVYMAATQAVSGHGGWPMSVFLTPEGQAFMAGTYYPPTDRAGQPGFPRLLAAMADAWANQRPAVLEQVQEIEAAASRDLRFIDRLPVGTPQRTVDDVTSALAQELVASSDTEGGFGPAPKFPRPSYVEALLTFWSHPDARRVATTTLDAMSREGLYDHFRGGFARYSVDAQWHVPHFEKMLCDQALLAAAYLRADRAAGGGTPWRDVALDTLRFVQNDLAVASGYASSLDADSAGEEGAHVTWTPDEVRAALESAGLAHLVDDACARWRITDPGLFEGRSIPRLAPNAPFVTPEHLLAARGALNAARASRPQPGRDEKVILEWNAMFADACCESGDPAFIALGTDLLTSLARTHHHEGTWFRTDARTSLATAADLGWMIAAHVSAYEATGSDLWLDRVAPIVTYLLEHHWDGPTPRSDEPVVGGGIFTTSDEVRDLATRAKDIFDGATPSSHAVAATALARLAPVSDDAVADRVAVHLIDTASALLDEHPRAVPDLVRAYGFVAAGRELVIPGDLNPWRDLLRSTFVPFTVLVHGSGRSPLLADRAQGVAYLCEGRACHRPAATPDELASQISLVAPRSW